MNKVSVCFSPALYPFYAQKDEIVIIIDIFRATTSICAAFNNGARSVRTVATTEEAIRLKSKGYPVAAERNTKRCEFADFGNSPFDFTPEKVNNRDLIFTTTNGTQAVEAALDAGEILIGSFSNIGALLKYCLNAQKDVLLLCSGWKNRFCIEDTLFAGRFADELIRNGRFESDNDAVKAARDLWKVAKSDLVSYICDTEHYQRLKKNGLENEIEYCLAENTTSVVPIYDKTIKAFINQRK